VTAAFISNERCWDEIAQEYDQATAISLDEVHYGPLVPGERTLNILGDVRGKSVLELGCGSGHNAVVLASQGARVLGIDISAGQLELAQRRVGTCKQVTFTQGDMTSLQLPHGATFDIILSVFALDFVPDLVPVLKQVVEHLRPAGRFVFSCKHPLAWHRASPDGDAVVVADYFAEQTKESVWAFDGTAYAVSRLYYRPLGSWFDQLSSAGLHIARFMELRILDAESAPYRSSYHMARAAWLNKTPYTMLVEARPTGQMPT
jgi:ubiquinone/menaquinone biosynthesis C-methylase UbiE